MAYFLIKPLVLSCIFLSRECFACFHKHKCGKSAVVNPFCDPSADRLITNPLKWRLKYSQQSERQPPVEKIKWGPPEPIEDTSELQYYLAPVSSIGDAAAPKKAPAPPNWSPDVQLSQGQQIAQGPLVVEYLAQPVRSFGNPPTNNILQPLVNEPVNIVIPLEEMQKINKAFNIPDEAVVWGQHPIAAPIQKSQNQRLASFGPESSSAYPDYETAPPESSLVDLDTNRGLLPQVQNSYPLQPYQELGTSDYSTASDEDFALMKNMFSNIGPEPADDDDERAWEISRSEPLALDKDQSRNLLGDIDAKHCSIMVKEWARFGTGAMSSMNRPARSSLDLRCSFEDDCCWQPKVSGLSFVASGKIPDDIMTTCFKTTHQPGGSYGAFMAPTVGEHIVFESCTVDCVSSSVVVKFKHWTTASLTIEVCSEEIYSGQKECIEVSKGITPLPAGESIAVLSQPSQPFRVQLVLRGFADPTREIGFIDDVSLSFDDCLVNPDADEQQQSPPSIGITKDEWTELPTDVSNLQSRYQDNMHLQFPEQGPTKSSMFQPNSKKHSKSQACGNVACSFEDDNFCKWYDTYNLNKKTVKWSVAEGGAAIGSHYAASYLLAEEESHIYAISDPPINPTSELIEFWHFEATLNVQLVGCCGEGNENCPFVSSPAVKSNNVKWTVSTFSCPPNTKTVHFICRNKGIYQGACGLDGITIIDKDTNLSVC